MKNCIAEEQRDKEHVRLIETAAMLEQLVKTGGTAWLCGNKPLLFPATEAWKRLLYQRNQFLIWNKTIFDYQQFRTHYLCCVVCWPCSTLCCAQWVPVVLLDNRANSKAAVTHLQRFQERCHSPFYFPAAPLITLFPFSLKGKRT